MAARLGENDIQFMGFVSAPRADAAANQARAIFGSGVYVPDQVRGSPDRWAVYNGNITRFLGFVEAKKSKEAKELAVNRFGDTDVFIDKFTEGMKIWAIFKVIDGVLSQPPTPSVTTPPIQGPYPDTTPILPTPTFPSPGTPTPTPEPTPEPEPTPTGLIGPVVVKGFPETSYSQVFSVANGQTVSIGPYHAKYTTSPVDNLTWNTRLQIQAGDLLEERNINSDRFPLRFGMFQGKVRVQISEFGRDNVKFHIRTL